MAGKKQLQDEIVKRLDILIALLLEQPLPESPASMSDKISRLASLGVPASDVAKVIGKPLNYVTAVLATKKARAKKAKKNG